MPGVRWTWRCAWAARFALLLYGANEHEARLRAEALRAECRRCAWSTGVGHGARSDPVGRRVLPVADPGNDLKRLYDLYEHADRALYEAKAFGRNQVVA